MAVCNQNLGNKFYKEHRQSPSYEQIQNYRDYRSGKYGGVEKSDCWYTSKSKKRKAKEKKKILKEYIIWHFEEETRKEKEYASRRLGKKVNRKLREKKPGLFRFFRVLTVIAWFVGVSITFCSTIRGIGEDTVFWKEQQIFRIIGPVIIGVGVVLLITTEAIRDTINRRQGKERVICMQSQSVSILTIVPSSSKSSSQYQRAKSSLSCLQHPSDHLTSILQGTETTMDVQL